jgi:predicted nucleic acid-binding protein
LGLVDELPGGTRVAFDADAIIYYVEEHDEFLSVVAPVFEMIAAGQLHAHVSAITLLEVLVGPLRSGLVDLANRYRAILRNGRQLSIDPFTAEVAEIAAELRAGLNLATPDAVVCASALSAGCTHLITNDDAFRRVGNLRVLIISEFASDT